MNPQKVKIMASKNSELIPEMLRKYRLVPVVSLPTVESAVKLSELLLTCNLPIVEITYRTSWAAEGIREITRQFPEMLVLAGTVLTPAQVDSAIDSGAAGIVSPGFSPKTAEYCNGAHIAYYPGVSTPSEVQTALDSGLDLLKFFPAEMAGGIKMLSLFQAVYPHVTFMPTGGITLKNVVDYLDLQNVACCGGTWLCPESLMADDKWAEIEQRVRSAFKTVSAG